MRNKEIPKKGTAGFNTPVGVLLLLFGIFLFLTLIDFHPEDSLYFNDQLIEEPHHFLGKPGAAVSSFFFYMMGRASYIFTFLLIYLGFLSIKKVKRGKKLGLLLVACIALAASLVILSFFERDILYKGGGLLGKSITSYMLGGEKLSTPYMQKFLLPVLFLLTLAGCVILLLKNQIFRVARLFSRIFFHSKGYNNKHRRENRQIVVQDIAEKSPRENKRLGSHGKSSDRRSVRKKTKKTWKKPPLIRKVYLDGGEVLHKGEQKTKEEEEVTPCVEPIYEDDKGQFLLQEPAFEEKKQKPKILRDAYQVSSQSSFPDMSLLKKSKFNNKKERERETLRKARELERTLNEFGIDARVTGIIRGPVITRYELQPAPGVKLSRIVNLSDNIALSLSANGVRIEAPIPGRSAVGIEIPNEIREIVTLGDIIAEAKPEGELPLILGKDIAGKIVVSDLCAMPHLLIAGATGSGKSVCVNSLIMSLLFHKSAEEVRFLMIDPKMVELKIYNGIPHLLTEVVTDPRDASKALRWLIYEMENRYRLLDEHFARDITGFNKKVREKLPYIVIIIDEFANLMAISQKEVEDAVVRLAAMSRAVGIHLIMATQRPSVDVITGLIKANFPYRIAFQVASKTDSRTILDTIGAEKLLGRGDMLFAPAGSMHIKRIQGAYILEEEVLDIVKELKITGSPDYVENMFSIESEEGYNIDDSDPIFDEAVEIVLRTRRASASFLQRRLKIGYNRAARLIELMEEQGIIGPPRGSKPREIYVDRVD